MIWVHVRKSFTLIQTNPYQYALLFYIFAFFSWTSGLTLFYFILFFCFPIQQGHCRTVWEPHCLHTSWALQSCSWDWCIWPQVQHRFSRSRYDYLLSIHREGKSTHCSSSRNRRAALQSHWELRTYVSTELFCNNGAPFLLYREHISSRDKKSKKRNIRV